MCSRVFVLKLIEGVRVRQAAEINEHANPLPPGQLQVRRTPGEKDLTEFAIAKQCIQLSCSDINSVAVT
jgi:hypothetical protein